MSGKSPYPQQGAYPTQGNYNAGPMPQAPQQHPQHQPQHHPQHHPAPGAPGAPPPYQQAQQMPPGYAPQGPMPPQQAQYYPQQQQQVYQPQAYPMMQPGGTVHVQGGFAAGARFDAGSSVHVPPPPPGMMPNAAQAGAARGQNVVVTQRQSDFWGGAGDNTGINMGW